MSFKQSSRNPSGKGMLRRNKSHQAGVIQNYKKFATKTFAGKRRFPKKKDVSSLSDAVDAADADDTTEKGTSPELTTAEKYAAQYEALLAHSGRVGESGTDIFQSSRRRTSNHSTSDKAGPKPSSTATKKGTDERNAFKKGSGRIHGAIAQRQQLKKEQQERERAIEAANTERAKTLKDKQARKQMQAKKLNMRTKRGQPILSFHMDNLLAKIQKGK